MSTDRKYHPYTFNTESITLKSKSTAGKALEKQTSLGVSLGARERVVYLRGRYASQFLRTVQSRCLRPRQTEQLSTHTGPMKAMFAVLAHLCVTRERNTGLEEGRSHL